MDKNKIIKIIITVLSLIIIIGSVVGFYFMYQNTYGKKDAPYIMDIRSAE